MSAWSMSRCVRCGFILAGGAALLWALTTLDKERPVEPAPHAALAQTSSAAAPTVAPLLAAPRRSERPPLPRRAIATPLRNAAETELAPGEDEPPLPVQPTRAELDATYDEEPKDEAWSAEVAESLRKELVERGFAVSALAAVDCRVTMCRTRIKVGSRAALTSLASLGSKLSGRALSLDVEQQQDGVLASVYLEMEP